MSRSVGMTVEGCLGTVVIVILSAGVVEVFLTLVPGAAELSLWVERTECAVVMSRLKSEMSGSSGLGQRDDVDMVLRVQS